MSQKLLLVGAGVLAGICVVALLKKSHRKKEIATIDDEELDRMIEQSFPASDAPAYY